MILGCGNPYREQAEEEKDNNEIRVLFFGVLEDRKICKTLC